MKNIKDRINSQLFKAQEVELSAEKVELGLAQDIEKKSENVFKESGKMEAIFQKIEREQDKLSGAIVELEKALSDLDSDYQQFRRNAKTLGLDVPKEVENDYKTALTIVKSTMATYKKFRK